MANSKKEAEAFCEGLQSAYDRLLSSAKLHDALCERMKQKGSHYKAREAAHVSRIIRQIAENIGVQIAITKQDAGLL